MTEHASDKAGQWMRGGGPDQDVVLSSRVRLARNLAGYPFVGRADTNQRRDLLERCRMSIARADITPGLHWVDLNDASSLDRKLLVERHLISRQHSKATSPRAVAISEDESIAVMINEEDHVRLQVLRTGMQLQDAYDQADVVDDVLERQLDFAFSSQLGYLTACPTNVGTGIRVSVMLHLPGLKLTGEIDKVRRAAKDMHLAVRGFYGEGTEAVGDLFQISNQTTLGKSEGQILFDFQDVVIPQIVEYERKARRALADHRATVLDDKVFRAWGTLSTARLLGSEEALYLLSYLRLGLCLDRIDSVSMQNVNELMLLIQSAHLQKIAARPLGGPERREFRARFVRERLGA
ncbi:MAG: protein arginine kinase [Phycisphaera sp.]|nr:protein arginine kinase [Phycisphaera sp.]